LPESLPSVWDEQALRSGTNFTLTTDIGDIEESMKRVMAFSGFNAGRRYEDFYSKTDNHAAYGVGALVAGKVAAKVGLFKLMLGAILAAKKLVVAVVAVGGLIARLLGRKKD
jgi:uncharacterized membrane-anchored protein